MSSDTSPTANRRASEATDASGGGLFHGFLSLQARGVIALPPLLRRRYGLDQPGAQVEVVERDDGVLEVRPTTAVPADQAWFWNSRWQDGEREVEEHRRRGEMVQHESSDAFIAHLIELDARAGQAGAGVGQGPDPA